MPTRRIPIIRRQRRPVTAEWAVKFCQLCECRAGSSKRGELATALRLHFKIPPWRSHLLRDDFRAPRSLTGDDLSAWWLHALGVALEEATAPVDGLP
jgi:hypothetical protein